MSSLYFAVPLYTKAKTFNLHKYVDFQRLLKSLQISHSKQARTEKLQKHFLATKDLWQTRPAKIWQDEI